MAETKSKDKVGVLLRVDYQVTRDVDGKRSIVKNSWDSKLIWHIKVKRVFPSIEEARREANRLEENFQARTGSSILECGSEYIVRGAVWEDRNLSEFE